MLSDDYFSDARYWFKQIGDPVWTTAERHMWYSLLLANFYLDGREG